MSTKKKKKLTPAYKQKIWDLEEQVSFFKAQSREMEIDRDKLKSSLDYSDKLLQQSANETALQTKKCETICRENEELKDRLQWAERRLTDAIEATNNAAIAAGAVSRLTNSLSMLFDTLESKLIRENKPSLRVRYPPQDG